MPARARTLAVGARWRRDAVDRGERCGERRAERRPRRRRGQERGHCAPLCRKHAQLRTRGWLAEQPSQRMLPRCWQWWPPVCGRTSAREHGSHAGGWRAHESAARCAWPAAALVTRAPRRAVGRVGSRGRPVSVWVNRRPPLRPSALPRQAEATHAGWSATHARAPLFVETESIPRRRPHCRGCRRSRRSTPSTVDSRRDRLIDRGRQIVWRIDHSTVDTRLTSE